ncbi:hypothetical protein DPMN_108473 [Dreissena polymorpha]|uniref:Uncharacterized protein n=1 Tax=Dreissena polymorpha TaxID=45954 RepID=A0A9D4K8K8_DREPO|nr:hypothetical protein DPMN_108473 [Dreissena polymorpha]
MTDSGSEDGTEWDSFRVRDEEEMEFFTELALHETERWIQVYQFICYDNLPNVVVRTLIAHMILGIKMINTVYTFLSFLLESKYFDATILACV